MKAVIVGAGIGGLATGLALHRAGCEVEVLEQASSISEVGAGIQISPNGVKALRALGVMEALEPFVFEPESVRMAMGRSGRRVFELPMKDFAADRWGAPFLQVHRADLQAVLLDRLEAEAGRVVITNAKATGYVRERGGAGVYLERGERQFGDLVVACDGVHSVVRSQMSGADRVRFTGSMAWRCTVPVEALGADAPPPSGCIWAGPGRHAVTTRIRAGSLVNFVGIVEQDEWQEEGWAITGTREDALRDFEGWVPQVTRVLENADVLNRWALLERMPLASWNDGPVTLLGDAAHPMVPSMAQGAVQALEDAVVLGACVKAELDKLAALARYQELRKTRTSLVQKRSAENLALFHRAGFGAFASYAPIWAAGKLSARLIHRRQDWIYGYDPSDPA